MKIKWLLFISASFILAACTTKRLTVQMLRPAEITLPESALRVGVVDRTQLAWAAPVSIFENGTKTTRFRDIRSIGPKKTIEGFIVELSGFKRFVTVPVSTPEKVDSLATQVPKASQEVLDGLETDSSLDILVSLEGYRAEISTDGNIYTSVYYDGFGNPFTVPRFQNRRTIKIVAFWRIYDLKRNVIQEEGNVETELTFSSNGYNPDESYRNLPEQIGSVENTSQVAGIDYAKKLIPFWADTERMIYLGQTNAWLDAADSAEVGNWASAAEQWTALSKKAALPIIQRQAVFNLFTAYEVLGNFDEAEYWAKQGQKKYKNRDFDAAIIFLDKRRIENELLDRQLKE
jgi:hypothetical protein